ncbi:kinase-like protein [Gigaspora margarita]|uniref:Kinase-like protein n=1 Tax=Gigaspora margarita TaxID=4874 RepID=A0A8H4ESC5_GIGMA|nr:kinase-like protein [Gigaspora margarita]
MRLNYKSRLIIIPTLSDFMALQKTLTWNDRFKLSHQIASAIKCLHSHNIVHGNLNSFNTLVHQDNIKISNFGLSNSLININQNPYFKPISLLAYKDITSLQNSVPDKKADIYSVGMLLWELSSGHPPFRNREVSSFFVDLVNDIKEDHVPGTPEKYIQIYTECWQSNRSRRPKIEEVANLLKKLMPSHYKSASVNERMTINDRESKHTIAEKYSKAKEQVKTYNLIFDKELIMHKEDNIIRNEHLSDFQLEHRDENKHLQEMQVDINLEERVNNKAIITHPSADDYIQPFIPLFNIAIEIVGKMITIYETAECSKKICSALLFRAEIAQTCIKHLQRKHQTNIKNFQSQEYYLTWVKFTNILRNIMIFSEEIAQLSWFRKYTNVNMVIDTFYTNIIEFEDTCYDLDLTIAIYSTKQREKEAQDIAYDILILKKSMDGMHSEIKTLTTEIAALNAARHFLKNATPEIIASNIPRKVYKILQINSEELFEPPLSKDNIRGSIVKKMFHGKEVACENVFDKTEKPFKFEILYLLGKSPYIITFYGLSVDNAMIIDWAEHGNLEELYTHYKINWPMKLQLAYNIFNGLVFMHQSGIHHYNIRCKNILITNKLEPKISIYRGYREKGFAYVNIDETFRWLAPERMKNPIPRYNNQSEMFSFGMLLWELCYQKIPYKGMDLTKILEHIKNKKRETLGIIFDPSPIPRELAIIIKSAWEEDPSVRPLDLELQLKFSELCNKYLYSNDSQNNIMLNNELHQNQNSTHLIPQSFNGSLFDVVSSRNDTINSYSSSISIQTLIPLEDGLRAHKKKNYKEAWKCFSDHANLENNIAKYWKGYYLTCGYCTEKDLNAARQLFKESADNGIDDAQLRYAFALIEDKRNLKVNEILIYMKMAADRGNSTALYNLGDIYWNGKLKVPVDKAKAEFYIKLAALKNQSRAAEFLEKIHNESKTKFVSREIEPDNSKTIAIFGASDNDDSKTIVIHEPIIIEQPENEILNIEESKDEMITEETKTEELMNEMITEETKFEEPEKEIIAKETNIEELKIITKETKTENEMILEESKTNKSKNEMIKVEGSNNKETKVEGSSKIIAGETGIKEVKDKITKETKVEESKHKNITEETRGKEQKNDQIIQDSEANKDSKE